VLRNAPLLLPLPLPGKLVPMLLPQPLKLPKMLV
jgi:hypothetical protein